MTVLASASRPSRTSPMTSAIANGRSSLRSVKCGSGARANDWSTPGVLGRRRQRRDLGQQLGRGGDAGQPAAARRAAAQRGAALGCAAAAATACAGAARDVPRPMPAAAVVASCLSAASDEPRPAGLRLRPGRPQAGRDPARTPARPGRRLRRRRPRSGSSRARRRRCPRRRRRVRPAAAGTAGTARSAPRACPGRPAAPRPGPRSGRRARAWTGGARSAAWSGRPSPCAAWRGSAPRPCASIADVASSRIRIDGSVISARASATRWRWPPDRVRPCSPTTVS